MRTLSPTSTRPPHLPRRHHTDIIPSYLWPTVTLAYLLRYPNPYSTHVVSTDTLSTHTTPSGCLHITRLHLKRGKLPASVTRFIPKIKESFVLEHSTIDPNTS